jgi:hypothetical protein
MEETVARPQEIVFATPFAFVSRILLVSVILIIGATMASASDIYLAQNAQGANTGADCADARAATFFNSSANWGTGAGQIGPGTTVHLCGTINGSAGGNGLTFQGSGASGNPITLKFESGAVLQAPYWGGGGSSLGGAIIMNGVSYVTVDGGTNGLVRATLNGTPGGACPGGTCSSTAHDGNGIMFRNCSNCALQNLEVGPIYKRTSTSDETTASSVGCRAVSKEGTCTNCMIQHNKLHDASSLIFYDLPSGSDSNLSISYNDMHDTSAGVVIAQGNGETGVLSSFSFNGNSVHDFASWNDHSSYNFHHDGIHVWTYTSALSGINIYDNHFYGDFGSGTSWIYYEQYAGGTGAINIFNNLFNFKAVPDPNLGAGGSRSIELEGNTVAAKIYNNTIYGLPATGTIASGIYMNATSAVPDLRNNIIGGTLEALLEGSRISTASNGNVYDFSGGSSITIGGGYNGSNFSGWQSACSCDGSSSATPPNLDSSYNISNISSSAYQRGDNLTGDPSAIIDRDLAGLARLSSGAWEAGAYTYNLSGTVNPPTGLTAAVQ